MRPSKPFFVALSQASSQSARNFLLLHTQVAQWQKLTLLIQPHFPSQGTWQVVYYQHGTLIIAGDNQALISQVRYLQHQFIQALKAIPALVDLEQIQIVLQTYQPTAKKHIQEKQLSNRTQQELQEAAYLVKDAKLSQALHRLASTTHKNLPKTEEN